MKVLIQRLLREALEDNWASYKGRMKSYADRKKEFYDSINSFKDITDDKIPLIIEFFGHEGYTYEEDAIDDITDKINEYKKFPDPVVLYRVIAVKDKKMINTGDLGEHFTQYEWAIDGDMMMSIGSDNWEDDWEPYVVKVLSPLSEIDVWQTIVQNLAFPNEHEINIKNNGKGVKIIKTTKL
jgi:hypothetical protein